MSDPIASRWPSLQWFHRNLNALIVCAILVAFLAAVLSRAARHAPGSNGSFEDNDYPGGGIIVDAQVLDIWLPQPWVDVATQESSSLSAQGQQGLRRFLERPQAPGLFYALTVRGRLANGGASTLTYLRDKHLAAGDFHELLDVLNTVAGRPPDYPGGLDYSTATLHVLPAIESRDELLEAVRGSSSPFQQPPSRPARAPAPRS
jgi:hypothetical protein